MPLLLDAEVTCDLQLSVDYVSYGYFGNCRYGEMAYVYMDHEEEKYR